MRIFTYTIPPEYDGVKLEQYLRNVHGYSGRIIIALKKKPEYVQYNGVHIRMVDPVFVGGTLQIQLEDQPHIPPNPSLRVKIVYEDDDVIVFDKPSGMPIHPSRNHALDTLGNFFAAHCIKIGQELIFRPVTRLDADTTGLCVVAKNSLSCSKLSGKIEKEYIALVSSQCKNRTAGAEELKESGTINAPLARVDGTAIKRCVDWAHGKQAVTHYEVVGRGKRYSLVKVRTETGRTHQIRVHFSYIGHPLAGDPLYGGDQTDFSAHMLHCVGVSFLHPTMNTKVYLCTDADKYTAYIV